MKHTFLFLITLLILSCSTRKQVVYYQDIDDKDLVPIDSIYKHPKIQVNDILNITTAALNSESVSPYSFGSEDNNVGMFMPVGLLKLSGYLVNNVGEINFPQLGKIYVEGMTTQEIQQLLQNKLSKYIKDPTVNVRIINFKYTIQGEIGRPGTYETIEENLTLPQALAQAGDLNLRARRNNIMIYRQENGIREVKRIDLTQTDWMNTEFFYVKPNDLIYVEPNRPQVKSAGFINGVGTFLSVFSILLSTTLIIIR
jgi:polysaccharide export outer membrane protein